MISRGGKTDYYSMTHNPQHRLQGRRKQTAALLFSAGFAALAGGGLVLAASGPADDLATGSIERPAGVLAPAPYELRIELGREGGERLWLAARLRENGGLIRLPVSWTVRAVDGLTGRAGRVVYSGDLPIADFHPGRGEYEVDVRYGYRRARQRIRILPGQQLYVTFILNVGGVRALTRLENIGPVHEVRAEQRVYALTGKGRGRLVAKSARPGRIMRLGAGDYRIESRFVPGNAIAASRVRVKPGILSSLELTARAGLARVEPAGGADESRWMLRDADGLWRHEGRGAASIVLAPGSYVMKASIGGQRIERRFSISAGQRRVLRLGPGE